MYITCTFTHMYMIKSDCYITFKFRFQISKYIQKSTMNTMYKLYVLTRTILNLKFSLISECHTFFTHRILTKVSKISQKNIHNNIETIHKICPVPQDFPKPQLFLKIKQDLKTFLPQEFPKRQLFLKIKQDLKIFLKL